MPFNRGYFAPKAVALRPPRKTQGIADFSVRLDLSFVVAFPFMVSRGLRAAPVARRLPARLDLAYPATLEVRPRPLVARCSPEKRRQTCPGRVLRVCTPFVSGTRSGLFMRPAAARSSAS